MSPDGSLENIVSHISNWHSIRPWAPSLSLAVREITSIDPSLASIGLEAAEEDPENGEEHLNGDVPASSLTQRKTNSVIADALAKGLSVNVNGSAWPRAFIRIDDQLDEAVIIIYALMPGRQYDIELGLAPAGQPSTAVRRQVTTEGNRTVPGTPPSVTPQITLEDRLNQLQHTLSAVNSERETLLASLKSARREAQKADSALRSEIDTLKRTSEKTAAAELRGKQKVLALQEAVKQAEELAEEVKRLGPELNARKEQKEAEHAKIKQEAERVRKEREEVEEKERKRLEAMKAELAGLTSKLEKLGGKREKLEANVIPDLEEKLKGVEKEIELEEQGLMRLETEDMHAQNDPNRGVHGSHHIEDNSPSYVPLQRLRHHSGGDKPTPIGRPSPAPIQRPPHPDHSGSPNGHLSQSKSSPLWSPSQPHRQPQAHTQTQSHGQSQTHNARSHSLHNPSSQNHGASVLLINPQRQGSLKSTVTSISSVSTLSTPSSTSLSSVSTSTPPGTAPVTSTLSSRAPAFEPSRSIGTLKNLNGHNHFHGQVGSNSTATTSGFSVSPSPVAVPIQRAPGAAVGGGRAGGASTAKDGSHGHQWSGIHRHGHGHGHGNTNGHGGFDTSR
ncbi:hypothetical protein BDZ97DRAFT_1791569 [Flammula alnicola]|nr:hypothetical protein BDZ97DRAFT_1791569 [Flammula alnicola]